MLEYEKKIPLSEEEYLTLLEIMCTHPPTKVQTNYYYDTDDFSMNKKGITCRIREKNGHYKATVKKHNMYSKDSSIELSSEVESILDDSLFAGMGVKLMGSLRTERTVIHSDGSCEIVLDKNTYLNFTDYELEVEYLPNCEERAQRFIYGLAEALYVCNKQMSISQFGERANFSKSKSSRFFERLTENKGGDKNAIGFKTNF